jgi:hypothetical protein
MMHRAESEYRTPTDETQGHSQDENLQTTEDVDEDILTAAEGFYGKFTSACHGITRRQELDQLYHATRRKFWHGPHVLPEFSKVLFAMARTMKVVRVIRGGTLSWTALSYRDDRRPRYEDRRDQAPRDDRRPHYDDRRDQAPRDDRRPHYDDRRDQAPRDDRRSHYDDRRDQAPRDDRRSHYDDRRDQAPRDDRRPHYDDRRQDDHRPHYDDRRQDDHNGYYDQNIHVRVVPKSPERERPTREPLRPVSVERQ